MATKSLYIIAGCNGAGKTTASFLILPEMLDCKEFVNADEIAKGLSPFQPEKVAVEAGRIMLNRIEELFNTGIHFAFETTLSTKRYKNKIIYAQRKGYTVNLLFFWLESIELAKERVKNRVQEGGHYIPDDVIERRYSKGIKNLFDIYLPLVDYLMILDNSGGLSDLIAEKEKGEPLKIINHLKFEKIKHYYEKHGNTNH